MIVSAEGLTVRYGRTLALDAVDLEARPGSVLGVVGPNGSGKSSLVKAIAGVVKAEGRVHFDGAARRPAYIGYMAQDISGRAALTVVEVILLGRLGRLGMSVARSDLDAVGRILADLGIESLGGRMLGELSGGQRQIVFLAQALAAEPRVLLLDEPISALDLRHQLEVMALVRALTRSRRLTTICVLHDLNATARNSDHVALLKDGRMAAYGAPGATLTERNLAEVFGVEARVSAAADGALRIEPLRPTRATGD